MTILTENFNTANSDTLGPTLTWVEDLGDFDVVSNRAAKGTPATASYARAASDLASINQYAQAKITSDNAAHGQVGVMVRKAASSTMTLYMALVGYGATDVLSLYRDVTGTVTSLAADQTTGALSANTQYTVRIEVVGDQLSTYFEGVLKHVNVIDTNIAGNLQTGIVTGGTGDNETVDDFEAGDLDAVQFVTSAAGGTNPTTSTTVTIPTVLLNDILILDATHNGTGDLAVTDNSGVGSWTKNENKANGTAMSGQLWWKRITNAATESAKTLTIGSATNSVTAVLTVYRGCVTSGDPIEAMVSESNASGNETQAEITVLTANAQVCLAVHQSPDVTTSAEACTTPGTLVHRVQHLSTGGTDCSTSHASNRKYATGATGAFTWAQTDTVGVSRAYALKPAVAAPTAYTMDADPGTYSMAGATSQTLAARLLDLTAGNYAMTGANANLLKGYAMELAAGGYAMTGADAQMIAARILDVSAGAYAMSGVDSLLVAERFLDAGAGGYAITGADALLVAQRTLNAGAGAYVLTGADALAVASRILEVEAGSYAIVGADAILLFTPVGAYEMDVDAGVYAVTGADALLVADFLLNTEPGVYAVTGAEAQTLAARFSDLGPGTYAITGADTTIELNEGVELSPGDLVQVVTAGGIECTVRISAVIYVRVVHTSEKKITVLTQGGTDIMVTI